MLRWSSGTWIGGLTLAFVLSLTAGAWAQEDVGEALETAGSETAEAMESVAEGTAGAVESGADEMAEAAETAVTEADKAAALAKAEADVAAGNLAIPEPLRDTYYYVVGEDDAGLAEAQIRNLNEFRTNNLWVLIAAFLVFIMHLGFACVESGLTRAKNTVNILFKNTMVPTIGIFMYALCGWMIMYPGGGHEESLIPNFFNFGFGIGGTGVYSGGSDEYLADQLSPAYHLGYVIWTDFLFQAMFAATCATIVSGAVAERVKLGPFLIFTVLFVGILYPITGSWKWGGGWLEDMGFLDFAGSTLVHAVGGAGALAGVLILGPRLNKYAPDGTPNPIPGHSMPMATIGVFLLWFGWFGFNGGSELSADPGAIAYVCMTTAMAACGGGIGAALTSWGVAGKPDLSMALNGILAGLVGITAGPDVPSWLGAFLITGVIPGVIVYFSVIGLDKLKIDDPVGAISVHGVLRHLRNPRGRLLRPDLGDQQPPPLRRPSSSAPSPARSPPSSSPSWSSSS